MYIFYLIAYFQNNIAIFSFIVVIYRWIVLMDRWCLFRYIVYGIKCLLSGKLHGSSYLLTDFNGTIDEVPCNGVRGDSKELISCHVSGQASKDVTLRHTSIALCRHAQGILTPAERLDGSLASKPSSFLRLLRLMNGLHYNLIHYSVWPSECTRVLRLEV